MASFQFAGANFEKAFDAFLSTNRLYVDKSTDVWTVTRIKIAVEGAFVTVDALDVTPGQIIERLAMRTNTTIIQDIMPSAKISIHVEKLSLLDAIEVIMKPYTDYTVVQTDKFVQIKKNPSQVANALPLLSGNVKIRESSGLYDINCEKVKLSDVLASLFATAKREYSSFARGDQVIERLSFTGKSFQESLRLVLEQSGAEYSEIDNIWYIFPLQQADVLKRLKEENMEWSRLDVKYLSAKDCASLLQLRYPGVTSITIPDGSGLLLYHAIEDTDGIVAYLRTIDSPVRSGAIKLKYIKTEDFFKALPPSVKREDLVDAGNGDTFFFTGSDEKRKQLQTDLAIIDRPHTRLRYDLLIIQSQDTSELNWSFNVDAAQMAPGDMTMVTGSLGNLLSLNFDAITVFGYQFAAKMNLALSENLANVFADTTLYGLSGEEIKFQNTNTYRYRDYYIDADTGKTVYTGVTREIQSGLVLNINGWASGDGMITTNVTASVSKRGTDTSSTVGNPPPTSEKVITTHVRSRSGEAIVLSGLRQNDSTIIEERIPGISRIPIIGWLFKAHNSSKENTQMVIYLVPHIDSAEDESDIDQQRPASLYARYIDPGVGGTR